MTSLEKLKCCSCQTLPDSKEISFCEKNHLTCGKCLIQFDGLCQCSLPIMNTAQNPLLFSLTSITNSSPLNMDKKPCRFKDLGCTWLFTDDELIEHLTECKYRIISCIGKSLGIFYCPWRGQQLSIGEHFQESHSDLGDFFTYFQEQHIPFNEFITSGTINLIDAFNKKFVFYFHSNAEKKLVYFAIILMGMKSEADHFSYEFTIKAPEENSKRKIKFVEDVYNTDFDIEQFLKMEQCVTLTHRTLKNHLFENNIHFRFVISKKIDEGERQLTRFLSQTSLNSAKTKVPGKVPNKSGKMVVNRQGGQSFTTGGGSKTAIVAVPRSSNAVHQGQIQNHSSINRLKISEGICRIPGVIDTPCFMPSINKSHTLDQQIMPNSAKLYIDPRLSIVDSINPVPSVIKTNIAQLGYKQQNSKVNKNRYDGPADGNSKYKNK